MDYGASLWRNYDFNEFIRVIEDEIRKKFNVGLDQRLKDFFGIGEEEVSVLREKVERNLDEGKFKFVVLMDKLHDQLKDLIFFINKNSRFDIFAVEMEYYKYENYEIMVPRLFGTEVKKDIGVIGKKIKWDETSFFEAAKNKLTDEQLKAVKKLYDFSKENADDLRWGTGAKTGTFKPSFFKICKQPLYTVYSDGTLEIDFGWIVDNVKRDEFRKEIEKIIIKIPKEKGFPMLSIDKWYLVVDDFIRIVQNLISEP